MIGIREKDSPLSLRERILKPAPERINQGLAPACIKQGVRGNMKFSTYILYPAYCILYLASCILPAFAELVTVEGMSSMENLTKEEARRQAVEDAMRNAIEEVVGASISAETLVINLQHSGDIIKVIPYGKVTDEEIIEEGVKEIREEGKTTPSLIYRVKMRVKVEKEKGDPDPYFKIEASLNRNVFKDGDEMEIRIRPTKDSYIAIFNILEDEGVIILIPNRY
ncbi:MAG: hypothetical protein HZA09_04660, partial [Nitrospirae bacterium]|nr:hypothetical protein [Nitrospirota bacterium]